MNQRQAIGRLTAGLGVPRLARMQDMDPAFPTDDFVARQVAPWQRELTEAGIRVA
ncbi:MAG: hypothetical protein JOY66_01160 [Acetobacteraceae bacterium]|nr:hypothetical protein [Acetobacteraceae bacterium]